MNDSQKNWRVICRKKKLRQVWQCRELYFLLLYPIVGLLIFHYVPMYGILLAFKENNIAKGILGGDWVGLEQFKRFFGTYNWQNIVLNTFRISITGFIVGFPIPIILAIFLNEIKAVRFKKCVQTVSYMPNFISTVVVVGMLSLLLDGRSGILAKMIGALGFNNTNIMGNTKAFVWIYVLSGIWQGAGFSSIIYLSALANVDSEMQEAARIDGATRLQRIWHIDLPTIKPTITILMIQSLGGLASVGFEKVYLMQNTLNSSVSEVISTYVYKQGLQGANYAYSTAIGLMNTAINFTMLVVFNSLAKAMKQESWF